MEVSEGSERAIGGIAVDPTVGVWGNSGTSETGGDGRTVDDIAARRDLT